MTIRSYVIAITVLTIFCAGLGIGLVWSAGATAEHFAGQDGDQ